MINIEGNPSWVDTGNRLIAPDTGDGVVLLAVGPAGNFGVSDREQRGFPRFTREESIGEGCSGFNNPAIYVSVKKIYRWIRYIVKRNKSNNVCKYFNEIIEDVTIKTTYNIGS